MQKKIERIIGSVGELSLSAMTSWFPTIPKDEIIKEINKSEKLLIEDDIIIDKSVKETKETEFLISKNLNLMNQTNVMKPKEIIENVELANNIVEVNVQANIYEKSDLSSVSYEDLIELINCYNKKVRADYKSAINKSFTNVSEAILKYYKKRFNIIRDDFQSEDDGIIYSLRHKKSGLDIAYLYIGEYLTKEALDKIAERFEYDTVYFCITRDAEVSPNLSTREFYLKDVEEITEEYLGRYKLLESKIGVLKIEER